MNQKDQMNQIDQTTISLGRCFSTWCTGMLGSPRKRNFAKDGIPVPGHKPIQQIAEGLDQWKAQED
jgi:hypothetical protein